MNKPLRKNSPMPSPINKFLIDLPAPSNLSSMWNFGSLLGLMLMMQIITGLGLTMHYTPHTNFAFSSTNYIIREVKMGWLMQHLHANGASMFFFTMYFHMGRGILFKSYHHSHTWMTGVTIFILSMATAFMGYLLPWGQMSFWGATVITNLFSAIPFYGKTVVMWLWGGYGVANPTLTRFFALHYLLPLILSLFALIHLIFLHTTGSNNPLGVFSNVNKSPFHPNFIYKDLFGMMLLLIILFSISSFTPNLFTDPDNFTPANPLTTPTHIKPEWYFLWAYAILRAIPNKLGGVMLLVIALLILYLFPLSSRPLNMMNSKLHQVVSTSFLSIFTILTFLGAQPVEDPFTKLGSISTVMYFLTATMIALF